jgi:hypothetical protein
MSTRPEWLEVGQPVAIASYHLRDTVRLSTVERFTKTRVVLANGDWYPLDTLRRSRGSFSSDYLKDPNQPSVVAALRYQQVRTLIYSLEAAMRPLSPNATDEQWNAVADLAEKLAQKARR